ncbi:hypothetical protein [Bradyrhizobium manausense]|uniref:Polysaccharide biosynthesis protein GtrA n=1 Tax=Bradyrhizobium manausense TaxID=989370 RepID=A0A0R3D591_9BRAD|nr:hypothetical protein [Bradyrhizobium manausense]KRQ01935.1 hypothetical protein AOQ71_35615 [Bradyrhizobium manausense]
MSPPRSTTEPKPAIVLAIVWAMIVVALGLPAIKTGVFDTLSTDDALRLVEVRDLLAGQGWFDLTQYRLDPPGIAMHWSRIVDAPLAVLILVLRPLLGQHLAEVLTLVLWPSLLMGAALWLAARIASQACAPEDRKRAQLAAIVVTALSIPALIHFRAGAIDHHNLQIVLLLGFVLCICALEHRADRAALAGLCGALSLAVGLEMLPAIAMASAVVVGLLVWKGTDVLRPACAFGAGLAGSSLLLALLLLPINSLTRPVCDAFGGPVLLLCAGGGVALLAVAGVARMRDGVWTRFAASGIAGALLLGAFYRSYPSCVASPYAQVDPLLVSFWLGRVVETMSVSELAQMQPQKLLGYYAFPLLTLGLCTAAVIGCTPQMRFRWIVSTITLAALCGESLWELRGAAAANIVAAPLCVAGIVRLRTEIVAGSRLVRVALLLSPATLGGIGLAVWPAFAAGTGGPKIAMPDPAASCQTISSAAALADLPPGRMMAPIDSGPAILAATEHAVFAGPYHRNNDGNLAMVHAMTAAPEAAHDMLRARQVDYILTCNGSFDQEDLVRIAPEGLAAHLGRGEAPDYLEPVQAVSKPGWTVWRLRK